jgi:uncharacterized protein (TIGR00369 family)
MTFPEGRGLPPAVTTLGFELSSVDPERGEVEAFFTGRPEFTNLMGTIQGGFVSAMLDATASAAVLAQLPSDHFAPTIEMKTSFFRPAPVGRLLGRARVVHRGKSIAFIESSLYDEAGELLASATATVRIVRR